MKNGKNIIGNAMAIHLSVSTWDGKTVDHEIGTEIKSIKGADQDSGDYFKQIVSKNSLRPITTARSQLRDCFYAHSRPWGDKGWRIIGASLVMKYETKMMELTAAFDTAVSKFINETYPLELALAAKRMGGTFNADDYPSPEELRSRFGVRMQLDTLSRDYSDIRTQLGDDAANKAEADAHARTEAALKEGATVLYQRVAKTLGRMATQLGNDKGRLFDSMVGDVRELVDILPGLNFENDPKLEEVRLQIAEKLTKHDTDTYKANPGVRAATAQDAAKILDSLNAMF